MIFYFSGTGNSRWVARQIGSVLNERLCDMARPSVPLPVPDKDETVGWVFPVHGWKPPQWVRRFIDNLPDGIFAHRYTWCVMTCGDDVGRTAQMFERRLEKQGLKPTLTVSLIMPNSYVGLPFFDIDADRLRAKKLHHAAIKLREVAEAIKNRRSWRSVHQGSFPRFKSYVLGPLFERFLMSDNAFRAMPACTGCGLCVRVCPVKNITLPATGEPQWGGRCTMCLACYHHCPQHAIALGRRTLHKGQYYIEKHLNELI